MILVYTFYNWNKLCYKVVRALERDDVKKMYIRGISGSRNLAKYISKHEFTHILGLGDFRKDSKKCRYEKRFINKYGNRKIDGSGPEYYEATWDLDLPGDFVISEKASWGPCNLSAYMLARSIDYLHLKSKLAFLHILGSFDLKYTCGLVNKLLDQVS